MISAVSKKVWVVESEYWLVRWRREIPFKINIYVVYKVIYCSAQDKREK